MLKNTGEAKQRSTSEVEAVALALVGEILCGAELRLAHEEAVGGEAVQVVTLARQGRLATEILLAARERAPK